MSEVKEMKAAFMDQLNTNRPVECETKNDSHSTRNTQKTTYYQAKLVELPENNAQLMNLPNTKYFTSDKLSGLVYHQIDGSGIDKPMKVCDYLQIIATTHNEHNDDYGRSIEFINQNNELCKCVIPLEHISNKSQDHIRALWRMGLQIFEEQYITQYLKGTQPDKITICVSKIGWYKGMFVLPDSTIAPTTTNNEVETVIYKESHLPHPFQVSGTLAEWNKNVGKLCVGNSKLTLVISFALALPLAHLLEIKLPGLHVVGSSSTGKTTLLRVAASVYGDQNYIQQWRATSNGLELLAMSRNNTPLMLDEISQAVPCTIGDTVYMIERGKGKIRMSKDIVSKPTLTFETSILSTGEESLSNIMETAGQRTKAGQQIRLIEIDVEAGGQTGGAFEQIHGIKDASEFANKLANASSEFYGTPIRAWLKILVDLYSDKQQLQEIKGKHKQYTSMLLKDHSEAEGQVRRVASTFAAIALAGEIAIEHGIIYNTIDDAYNAAKSNFDNWVSNKGNAKNHEETVILRQIRSIFERDGESRFTKVNKSGCSTGWDNTKVVPNRIGFVITTKKAVEYCVFSEQYIEVICKGRNPRTVSKVLEKRRWLKVDLVGKKKSQTRQIPDTRRRSRVYVFDAAKVFEDDIV